MLSCALTTSRGRSPPPRATNNAATASIPSTLLVGDLLLSLTTTSRSADAAAATARALCDTSLGRGTAGTSVARRASREASLQAFCFVVEEDENAGRFAWYYAPLEDYEKKKLRVDESVVKSSLSPGEGGSGKSKKSVDMYFRLPGSTTFRQLVLAREAATATTTTSEPLPTGVVSSTPPDEPMVCDPGKECRTESKHSPQKTSSREEEEAACVVIAGGNGAHSPPPLAPVDHNGHRDGQWLDSCEQPHTTGSTPCGAGEEGSAFDPDRPQPTCVLVASRYRESDMTTELSLTPINEGNGLPLPLSIALQQSEDEDEMDDMLDGFATPLAPCSDNARQTQTLATSDSTTSSIPRCPPKPSAATKPNGRRRQKQQQILAAAGASAVHPCDPATTASPKLTSIADSTTNGVSAAAKNSYRLDGSANASCDGLTEQSTTYSLGADVGVSSEDPGSPRRTSSSAPRTLSDLARAPLSASRTSAGFEMMFTVNPFTPTPPSAARQRRQTLGSKAMGNGAQDDMGAHTAHAPIGDRRTKHPLQVPARPNIHRAAQPLSVAPTSSSLCGEGE